MILEKEQRYDKITTEINDLIDQMIDDIQKTIYSFDRNKFMQNCINEYLKQENIVESSKSTQKVIKTSEFALFLFNKEKENQAEIINNMNIKFADFEFQIASKIKKFGDCNHELEDSIIKKPTFLQTIFNKPLMQKYNEKIKEFNDLNLKVEHLEKTEKEFRKGKTRRIIKSFIDLPNKLNQITFDLFSITKAHEAFKNIDIQSKLFKDEVSHPSLEELLSLSLFKEFEDNIITKLHSLITELHNVKSKNIITKAEKFSTLEKETTSYLDNFMLIPLKKLYFCIDNLQNKLKDMTKLEYIIYSVFIISLGQVGAEVTTSLFKDKPTAQALALTATQLKPDQLVGGGAEYIRDKALNSAEAKEAIKPYIDYLHKTNQTELADKIETRLNNYEQLSIIQSEVDLIASNNNITNNEVQNAPIRKNKIIYKNRDNNDERS